MNRREFLWSAALIGSVGARLNGSRFGMPAIGRARHPAERPAPLPQSLTADGWRIFEITTHAHMQNASRVTRAWLPTPLVGGVSQHPADRPREGARRARAPVRIVGNELDRLQLGTRRGPPSLQRQIDRLLHVSAG